jgi:hypothetical protein
MAVGQWTNSHLFHADDMGGKTLVVKRNALHENGMHAYKPQKYASKICRIPEKTPMQQVINMHHSSHTHNILLARVLMSLLFSRVSEFITTAKKYAGKIFNHRKGLKDDTSAGFCVSGLY